MGLVKKIKRSSTREKKIFFFWIKFTTCCVKRNWTLFRVCLTLNYIILHPHKSRMILMLKLDTKNKAASKRRRVEQTEEAISKLKTIVFLQSILLMSCAKCFVKSFVFSFDSHRPERTRNSPTCKISRGHSHGLSWKRYKNIKKFAVRVWRLIKPLSAPRARAWTATLWKAIKHFQWRNMSAAPNELCILLAKHFIP